MIANNMSNIQNPLQKAPEAGKLIYISILNWNDATSTIQCLSSLENSKIPDGYEVAIFIVDNGSNATDKTQLAEGLSKYKDSIIWLPENVGFASGHNTVVEMALQASAEFIWLVNNDSVVTPETLVSLLDEITLDEKCAIISPLIFSLDDENQVDFVGARQDWTLLDSRRAPTPEAGKEMQEAHRADFFVYGTAPLIRCAAIRSVGALASNYFAYYEDEEFCARLSNNNWTCKMAFHTRIRHKHTRQAFADRPPYYFYLMARNSIHFYKSHTPVQYRRLIVLRLFGRSMIKAALLRESGHAQKANACLLGTLDGLKGRGGKPDMDRTPPHWLVFISKVFPYRLHLWLG